MNYDVLLQIVKATRLSAKLADALQGVMPSSPKRTIADDIYGFLADALYAISGENAHDSDNFGMTIVSKLIMSDMSDGDVAKQIMKSSAVQIPAPNLVTREETRKLYEQNGGYLHDESETPPAKVYDKLNRVTAKLRKSEKESLKLRLIAKDAVNMVCKGCDKNKYEQFGCCDLCRFQKYKRGETI